jgi:tRNA dimethylallyltransferase
MFKEPDLDQPRLDRLRQFLNALPQDRLDDFVGTLDPDRGRAGQEGRQRATRTVEMALLTGRPLSWWHQENEPEEEPLAGLIVLLNPPREVLYEKINRRVGLMVEEGLIEEVKGLLKAGYRADDPGMTGAGYREIVRYILGELTIDEATEEIRRSHRKYARRQTTWFRHQLPSGCLVVEEMEKKDEMAKQVLDAWAAAEEKDAA